MALLCILGYYDLMYNQANPSNYLHFFNDCKIQIPFGILSKLGHFF